MTANITDKNLGIGIDVGRRRAGRPNQDSLGHYADFSLSEQQIAQKGQLYVLADGMGGAAGGAIASNMAVQFMLNGYYRDHEKNIPRSLNRAIQHANRHIQKQAKRDPTLHGMGTTIVAGVLHDDHLYLAHVGDSRAYLLRNGQLQQLSEDHTLVQEQLRAGLLTKKQAAKHPQRHWLSRNLGAEEKANPDFAKYKLEQGDTVLLCSDGLWNEVSDQEMATVLGKYHPSKAAQKLVDLANSHGGSDNISLIVRQADWLRNTPQEKPSRKIAPTFRAPAELQPAIAATMQIENPYMAVLAVAMLLTFFLMIAYGMGMI